MNAPDNPLERLIDDAFAATCEAEALIYAGGLSREIKDSIIAAHSALLRCKLDVAVARRAAGGDA